MAGQVKHDVSSTVNKAMMTENFSPMVIICINTEQSIDLSDTTMHAKFALLHSSTK